MLTWGLHHHGHGALKALPAICRLSASLVTYQTPETRAGGMATKRQSQIIENYRLLMEEAKMRLDSIDAALSGLITIIPVPGLREYCFLQLRMLCELIALACLTAHGDIPATKSKKLFEAWAPDRILAELERLHPEFYPIATRDGPPEPGVDRHVMPLETEYLTRAELIRLYALCGGHLHRGSLRSLYKASPWPEDHSDIREWRHKIGALLRQHLIALLDPRVKIVCVLKAADDQNRTHVGIAEAVNEDGSLLSATEVSRR
jgi:hypothetical protein